MSCNNCRFNWSYFVDNDLNRHRKIKGEHCYQFSQKPINCTLPQFHNLGGKIHQRVLRRLEER